MADALGRIATPDESTSEQLRKRTLAQTNGAPTSAELRYAAMSMSREGVWVQDEQGGRWRRKS